MKTVADWGLQLTCCSFTQGDNTLIPPERPGNKVACSLSNILSGGRVTVSFLTPGCGFALTLTGTATLNAAPNLLAALAINRKVPAVATVLRVQNYRLQRCSSRLEAGLGSPTPTCRAVIFQRFQKCSARA